MSNSDQARPEKPTSRSAEEHKNVTSKMDLICQLLASRSRVLIPNHFFKGMSQVEQLWLVAYANRFGADISWPIIEENSSDGSNPPHQLPWISLSVVGVCILALGMFFGAHIASKKRPF